MTYNIQLSKPSITDKEIGYVERALLSGWITEGEWHEKAGELLKRQCRRKYCLLTSNGTMALAVAQLAIGVNSNSAIAVPSMCFAGVAQAGPALHVMLDVDVYGQISPLELAKYLDGWKREAPLTACIAVDTYGEMPDYDAIESFCRQNRIYLIEDAAEAYGASYRGRPAGSFGDISIFSFYANKIVTAGEGGALLTDDPVLYAKAKAAMNFGRTSKVYHDFPGTNGRMTEMQAAVLTAQLERYDELVIERRRIQQMYGKQLPLGERCKAQTHRLDTIAAPWLYCIEVPSTQRDMLLDRLTVVGVESRPFFPVLTAHKGLRVHDGCCLTTGIGLSSRGICLPLWPGMTEDEVEFIAFHIKRLTK